MRIFSLLFVLSTIAACQNQPVATSQNPKDTVPERSFRDSLLQGAFEIRHLVFGKFCGMCPKNCATMYTYNMMGNANTLFVDESDGFFKGKVAPKTPLNQNEFHQLASNVYRNLPQSFFRARENETTFGCPDCADQCGLYMEIGRGSSSKKFRIDTNTEALEGDVRDFAGVFIKTLQKMDSLRSKKP